MSESLSVKYRPKVFEDVLSQSATIKILEKQLETGNIKHCYLFAGPSGVGKTTLGRILARRINNNQGQPIEIDAASNNGVDNVRDIIEQAKLRSIDSTYKVFIIDEVHSITSQGWQAFLKTLEEPPEYTIFIFCTTNPEKTPDTIRNRVQRFNLSKIPTDLIRRRLEHICEVEGFTNYTEACDFIAKLSSGGARDAICSLEKCADFSKDLTISNVLSCLGSFSYDGFFDLTNACVDKDEATVINLLEVFYNEGKDMKLFVEQYLDFCLDVTKYCLLGSMSSIKIPASLEAVKLSDGSPSSRCLKYVTGFDGSLTYFNNLVQRILDLKNMIRYDVNPYNTIVAVFMNICGNN